MGDNQASLRGFPSPRKRSDGDDGDEGARATQARLKVVDRAQQQLRTVDVERLIPEDHPARAIWEFVGRLDLSGYTDQVRSVAGGAGLPAFDPQLLVSLWVYSYSQSVSSARAIERLCEHHPAYQWLTGMQSISAHTLSDFRVTHAQDRRWYRRSHRRSALNTRSPIRLSTSSAVRKFRLNYLIAILEWI